MSFISDCKNLLFESLKDNKKLIIGLYIFFIVVFIVSWIYASIFYSSSLSSIISSNQGGGMGQSVSMLSILSNNEWGGVLTYISSIFFGVPAIIFLAMNAFNLGVMGQLLSLVAPNGGLMYIIYLIPHGIFEITATVLESVAGILLFSFIWKYFRSSRDFSKTKKVLIQSVVLFVFSAILLVIAAPIETYVSYPFSQFVLGLFGL